jgi:putative membrane protein insertion efficiency factor
MPRLNMRRPRRRWALWAGAAALGLLWLNGPAVAIGGIHAYQRTVAPLLSLAGADCRFTPTCSRYAESVIARDGLVRGSVKTAARLARCGPWTSKGTRDEP